MQNNENIKTNIENKVETCPKCGKDLILKTNRKTNHQFYGCSGYPECDFKRNILSRTGRNCPVCASDLLFRDNKEKGTKFIGCSKYPECRYTLNIDIYEKHIQENPDEPLPIIEKKPRGQRTFKTGERSSKKKDENGSSSFKSKPQSKMAKQSFTGLNEKVVSVKRISKTTKGGRSMRFSALAIIGDKNGLIGYGIGKSIEVPVAIRKALKDAKNNLTKVKITKNGTLYHEIVGRQGAGKVLLKPAPEGTGIIAGGPIRVALELAGYTDVYSKNLGKNTSLNMVMATVNGLKAQRTPKEVADLRDKDIKNL